MTNETFKYDYLLYNVHGVLRPNLLLIAGLFFLCRHIVLFVLVGLLSFRGGGKGTEFIVEMLNPVYNTTDILPAMMLIAMGARGPNAKTLTRWLWKHGRLIILFSITLFLAIFGFRTQLAFSTYGVGEWVVISLNGVIALHIGASGFIRDLFNEFPPPVEAENP